ncbi:hypothetical protein HOC80_04900 [archaeon]|jgi:hypothetical protein|nr:hypothetical protein [archaeon]MBT4417411.1 hypothetical protein [archaeon]
MENKKIKGYIMAGVGFLMILVNALSYLLNWEGEFVPIFIIGLVFVAVGMSWVRYKSN